MAYRDVPLVAQRGGTPITAGDIVKEAVDQASTGGDGGDLAARVAALETQLAAAMSRLSATEAVANGADGKATTATTDLASLTTRVEALESAAG